MLRIPILSLLGLLLGLGLGFGLGRATSHVSTTPRLAPRDEALVQAVKADNASLARLLLHDGADPNTRDGTSLALVDWALAGGHAQVAAILLDAGARADLPFQMKEAVGRLDWDTVQVLTEHGAPVNLPDAQGREPLIAAAATCPGAAEALISLIQHGADVNARDPEGNTSLILAAGSQTDHDSLVQLFNLLKGRGADFNASNKDGKTALMAAAEAEDDDALRLLLDRGADPHRRDQQGRTAVAYARYRAGSYPPNSYDDVIRILAARGVKE